MNLDQLKAAARARAVWFRIEYSEGEDTWYGNVLSAASSECWEFKRIKESGDLMRLMWEHIDGLDPSRPLAKVPQ